MDTIICFCKKRDLQQPELIQEKKKGYRLVRVAVCGGEDCWFGQSLTDTTDMEDMTEKAPLQLNNTERNGAEPDGTKRNGAVWLGIVRLWRKVHLWKSEGRQRYREKQEKLCRQQCMEERFELVERQLRELAEAIQAETEELDTCTCVYAEGADRFLKGNGILARMWENVWDIREFTDYKAFRWAGCLLPYVSHFRFVVLGTADCAPEIIKSCARRMKSLRWIVRERDCDEGLQEFVEEFYEDYGLAVALQTVEGRNGFRRLCIETVEPVCVLDFTEEVKFFWGGIKSDSVWLDFSSQEEKERRMRRLAPGIRYYSLKKLWSSGL